MPAPIRSLLSLCVLSITTAVASEAPPVVPFDKSKYSWTETECDTLAAHPDDPDRNTTGVKQADVDLPKAIAACQAAVAADPKNPRVNYQLARVLGYSGRGAEAAANRQAAVAADYPQALFVVGYISLLGWNQHPKDVCCGAELIRRSAQQGRLAGQLGFPTYVLQGWFKDCPVKQDRDEMLKFVAAARKQIAGDYYKELLADNLERDLSKL
jgi:hypothetical protein